MNITCEKCGNNIDIEKNNKCPYCNNIFENSKAYLTLKNSKNINNSDGSIKKNIKVTKTTTVLKLGEGADVNEICDIIQNEGIDAAIQRIKEIDPNVKIDKKINKCKETSIDEDPLLYINKNRTKSSNIKLLVVLILIVSLLILSKIFII